MISVKKHAALGLLNIFLRTVLIETICSDFNRIRTQKFNSSSYRFQPSRWTTRSRRYVFVLRASYTYRCTGKQKARARAGVELHENGAQPRFILEHCFRLKRVAAYGFIVPTPCKLSCGHGSVESSRSRSNLATTSVSPVQVRIVSLSSATSIAQVYILLAPHKP